MSGAIERSDKGTVMKIEVLRNTSIWGSMRQGVFQKMNWHEY